MWFEGFFDTISRWIGPGRQQRFDLAELSKLDPSRFYVENVRALLNTSTEAAREICEAAVRRGTFVRGIDILCPDGSVAASADTEDGLPPAVDCVVEDLDSGFARVVAMPSANLARDVYYRLAQ